MDQGPKDRAGTRPDHKEQRGVKLGRVLRSLLIGLIFGVAFPGLAVAACLEENFALHWPTRAYAADPDATIQYFGHNFFQIVTSRGTSVVTDPLGPGMYPDPGISGHVVTVGREHINHNYVPLIRGRPRVLRGLVDFGAEWNRVRATVKDVFIYNMPIYQNGFDADSVKGAAFIFDLGKLCIAHLGDLSHKLTKKQLKLLGHVDVALVPISGRWTMDPYTAREVLQQIKPKIAIPMHYRDRMYLVQEFAVGFDVEYVRGNTLTVSKEGLPKTIKIVVLTPPGAFNEGQ